jgi:hypothetical protein
MKIFSVITDNDSNMVKAFEIEWFEIDYCVHNDY